MKGFLSKYTYCLIIYFHALLFEISITPLPLRTKYIEPWTIDLKFFD